MTRRISLKQKITKVAIAVFLTVGLVTVLGIYVIQNLQIKASEGSTYQELSASIERQAQSFVPMYLLQEQRAGKNLMLDDIKMKESLNNIELVDSKDKPIRNFKNCSFKEVVQKCISDDGKFLAVVAPIVNAEKTLGFLLKTKERPALDTAYPLGPTIASVIALLLITLFILLIILTRITSKYVPESLDNLTLWLEDILSGKSILYPLLNYSEVL